MDQHTSQVDGGDEQLSVAQMLALEPERRTRYFQWWYNLLGVPIPSANASYIEREKAGHAKLFSIILLLCLIGFASAAVFTIWVPNKIFVIGASVLTGVSIISAILGRLQQWQWAAFVETFALNIIIMVVILNMQPRGVEAFQHYDGLLLPEILAASLIRFRWVFMIIVMNFVFICVDIATQTFTPDITQLLQTGSMSILILRPLVINSIAAGVIMSWIAYAKRANKRADRAEMVATLEHRIVQQQQQIEREKQELEQNIQGLVQAHVDAANNQIFSRVAYPEAKILWPLVGVINSLRTRLLREHEVEQKYAELERAIEHFSQTLQDAGSAPERMLPGLVTRTPLDVIIPALHKFYYDTQTSPPKRPF